MSKQNASKQKDAMRSVALPTQTTYLRRLGRVAESTDIELSEDLYSSSGVLLLTKGTKIDQSLYDRLKSHTLAEPIDNTLSFSETISNDFLKDELYRSAKSDTLLQDMIAASDPRFQLRERFTTIIGRAQIDRIFANKLFIAMRDMPEIYQHALNVANFSVLLATNAQLSVDECKQALFGGLFHDLGYLHIPAETFDRNQSPSGVKKAMVAHPIIIANQLKSNKFYAPVVADAVLEHHERLDGSGYPRGRKSFSSRVSEIVALAELAVSLLEKSPLRCLLFLLMLHEDWFSPALLGPSRTLMRLAQESLDDDREFTLSQVILRFSPFVQAVETWPNQSAINDPKAVELFEWLDARMKHLIKLSGKLGFGLFDEDESNLMALTSQAKDVEFLRELYDFASELEYSLKDFAVYVAEFCEHHPEAHPKLARWVNAIQKM